MDRLNRFPYGVVSMLIDLNTLVPTLPPLASVGAFSLWKMQFTSLFQYQLRRAVQGA